jgi:MFS family permease
VASIFLAMTTSFPIALVLMAAVGAGGITMAATANATIQLSVPDGLRGRVMSVYTTVFSASVPVGGLAMGALASAFGISVSIAIGGVLSLATGLVAFVWWQRIRAGWSGSVPAVQPGELAARQLTEVQAPGLLDGQPPARIR